MGAVISIESFTNLVAILPDLLFCHFRYTSNNVMRCNCLEFERILLFGDERQVKGCIFITYCFSLFFSALAEILSAVVEKWLFSS